jgi:hypothetical protein
MPAPFWAFPAALCASHDPSTLPLGQSTPRRLPEPDRRLVVSATKELLPIGDPSPQRPILPQRIDCGNGTVRWTPGTPQARFPLPTRTGFHSLDLIGIKPEELMVGVELGGVLPNWIGPMRRGGLS